MGKILIHNSTIIDGTGADPIPNGAVYIEDNRIVTVGPMTALKPPDDVTRIDAGGGTILPGLIDAHVHMMFEYSSPYEMMSQPFSLRFYNAVHYMRRTLMAGITTVRDAGGTDQGLKQAQQTGLVTGPRLRISTAGFSSTAGHSDGWMPSGTTFDLFPSYPGMPHSIVDGVDQVRRGVRDALRAGADVIKIMATGGVLSPNDHPDFIGFSQDELNAIVEEATNRHNVPVMAHAQGLRGIKLAVEAGIHSIEHGIFLDDEACDMMIERGTFLVPTLLAPIAVIEIAQATGAIPEYGIRKAQESIEAHRESISLAVERGVKIAMGTDAGVMPHGTNLRELGLMAACGMSPMDVLVATTKTAAECLQIEDQIGTLAAGKLADVIITTVDPLADLTALEDEQSIALVMQDGVVHKNTL
jgi:imidazolonepropionase-like amidohydrolase